MKKSILILLVLILIIAGSFVFARNSNLKVIVESEDTRQVLSGAKIEISSGALMQKASMDSNENGLAVFYDLPPGVYELNAFKDGFESRTIKNLKIGIKKSARIIVYLPSKDNLTGSDGNTDYKYSNNFNSSFTSDYDLRDVLGYLPVPKNFTNILLLPGGVSGRDYVSILGSGAYDSAIYLDGVNHTNPVSQEFAFDIGVDFLQGTSTYLTGIPAEYGFMTGGVVEILTEGGSNRFHAGAYLLLRRNLWNDISNIDPRITTDDRREGSSGDSWLFTAGGFLWKDAAWWHLSYEALTLPQQISRRTNPMDRDELIYEEKKPDYYAISFKGTFQPATNLKGSVTYFKDVSKYYNEGARGLTGSKTQLSADRSTEKEGERTAVTFSYLLADSMLIEGAWSYLKYIDDQVPQDGTQTEGISFISSDLWYWGAVPYLGHQKDSSEGWKFSSSFYADLGVVNDIKIGLEYNNINYEINKTSYPSNILILTDRVEGVGFENAAWTQKNVYENRFPETVNRYAMLSFYLQDSLNLGDFVVLDAGMRVDSNEMYNNRGTNIYSGGILDTFSPRVGIAWQLDNMVIRGSFARYYDQLWIDMAYDMNIYEPETRFIYNPADGVDGRNGWMITNVVYGTQSSGLNSIDENLVPQHCDEFALSFDWDLSETMNFAVIGATRVYRDLVVAEDLNTDGINRWQNLTTDAYGTKWKSWEGIVFFFRTRSDDNRFFLNADFTLSREECLISSDSVYGEYLINPVRRSDNAGDWWGISDDPTMQLALQTFYVFPNDWYLGMTMDWNNGSKYSTHGTTNVVGFGRFDILPNGRGDVARMPDAFQMNLQFGIVNTIQLPLSVDFIGSEAIIDIHFRINNLTNNQYPLAIGLGENTASYLDYTSWNRARWYQVGIKISL
jgi:hypothetical protein